MLLGSKRRIKNLFFPLFSFSVEKIRKQCFFNGRTQDEDIWCEPSDLCAIVKVWEEALPFQSGADCFLFLTSAQEFLGVLPRARSPASIPAAATSHRLLMSWGFAASKCWVICSGALLMWERQKELRCEVEESKEQVSSEVLRAQEVICIWHIPCKVWRLRWRLVLCQLRHCSCCEVRTGRWGKAQEVQLWWLLVHSTEEEKKSRETRGKLTWQRWLSRKVMFLMTFCMNRETAELYLLKPQDKILEELGCKTGRTGRVVGKALPLHREMQQNLWSWSECGGPHGIHSWRLWHEPQAHECTHSCSREKGENIPSLFSPRWKVEQRSEFLSLLWLFYCYLTDSCLTARIYLETVWDLVNGRWSSRETVESCFQETNVSVDKIFQK